MRLAPLLFAIACAPSPQDLDVRQSPPPGLTLVGPPAILVGETLTLQVTDGLAPNELVYFARGTSIGGGPCPSFAGGLCIGEDLVPLHPDGHVAAGVDHLDTSPRAETLEPPRDPVGHLVESERLLTRLGAVCERRRQAQVLREHREVDDVLLRGAQRVARIAAVLVATADLVEGQLHGSQGRAQVVGDRGQVLLQRPACRRVGLALRHDPLVRRLEHVGHPTEHVRLDVGAGPRLGAHVASRDGQRVDPSVQRQDRRQREHHEGAEHAEGRRGPRPAPHVGTRLEVDGPEDDEPSAVRVGLPAERRHPAEAVFLREQVGGTGVAILQRQHRLHPRRQRGCLGVRRRRQVLAVGPHPIPAPERVGEGRRVGRAGRPVGVRDHVRPVHQQGRCRDHVGPHEHRDHREREDAQRDRGCQQQTGCGVAPEPGHERVVSKR
jgi:hypothetical protein